MQLGKPSVEKWRHFDGRPCTIVLLRLFVVIAMFAVASGIDLKVEEPAATGEDEYDYDDVFHNSSLLGFARPRFWRYRFAAAVASYGLILLTWLRYVLVATVRTR